jgi:hypothetical protein
MLLTTPLTADDQQVAKQPQEEGTQEANLSAGCFAGQVEGRLQQALQIQSPWANMPIAVRAGAACVQRHAKWT